MSGASPVFADDCLLGRRIVISGGSGALGQAIVRRLLAHGARVLNLDPQPFPPGLPAHALPQYAETALDIGDEAAVAACFAGRVADFAPDTLLCHAGVVRAGELEHYAYADWRSTLTTNLDGHFLVARAALPLLLARASAAEPARIIFTSSWVSQVPWPGNGAYSPSKAALDMLARCLARELAGRHVRVNLVSPGIVDAGMARHQWDSDPEFRARAQRAIPLGQLQHADSVADALLFLCSRASDYMTGANLVVDGGASLYPMN